MGAIESGASSGSLVPAVQTISVAARGARAVSPFLDFVRHLAGSIGLTPLFSTQAGLVALTIGAATVAAGVTLMLGLSSARKASSPWTFAGSMSGASGHGSGSSLTGTEMPGSGRPASLDLVAKANTGNDAAADAVKDDAKAAEEPAQESAPSNPEPASGSPEAGRKPALAASKPMSSGSGFMAVGRLNPMGGLSSGIGQGFQNVYKGPAQGKISAIRNPPRANFRANRRVMAGGKRGAMSQLKAANKLSRQAAAMPSGAPSAATASTPFDAQNPGTGGLSAPAAAGAGQGGSSVGTGGSSASDQKDYQPAEPPSPSKSSKNKTPYQGMIYAGVAALAIGMILLVIAGMLVSKAQQLMAVPSPASIAAAMMLYSIAKMLAVGAAAAGAAAMGAGAAIMSQFGQKLQGGMFIVGGGVLTATAVIVLMSAEKASSDAQTQLDKINATKGGEVNELLKPNNDAGLGLQEGGRKLA